MSGFFTEKETEAFLQNESRILILPDGRKESVTTFRLIWESFDLMQDTRAFTNQELIGWSYNWYMREQKYDFATYFENLVAFAFSHVKKQRYGQ